MNSVFEKIIEKLEEQKKGNPFVYGKNDKSRDASVSRQTLDYAIEIVKQEAEQYEECYNDCGECEAYNKEKHHCPKFCKVIKETVKEIEENHNGWIPCEKKLPTVTKDYLVTKMCENDDNPIYETAHEIFYIGDKKMGL